MSRYIDLENWEDFINTIYNQCDTDATWDRANNIIDGLCMLATDDVEQIIHAHWNLLNDDNICECSKCLVWFNNNKIHPINLYKRCPCCGAHMNKEDKPLCQD